MSEEQINTEESEDRLSDKTKDQPGTEKKRYALTQHVFIFNYV